MFGFFNRKRSTASSDQSADRSYEPVRLTEVDLQFLAQLVFKGNANSSLFYAHCAGFQDETINDHNERLFAKCVLEIEPDEFAQSDVKRATTYRLQETIFGLTCSVWENIFSLITTNEQARRASGMNEDKWRSMDLWENGHSKNQVDYQRVLELRNKLLASARRDKVNVVADVEIAGRIFLQYCLNTRNSDWQKLTNAIDEKFHAIGKIFRKLRNNRVNKYGDIDLAPEINEIDEFIRYQFQEDDFNFYYNVKPYFDLIAYIDAKNDQGVSDDIPTDGIEFEHWCADKIRAQGWDVSVSKASGDQGVDVVAKRGGVSVAIQCKRYANPIGNKAVQEVFTGAQNEVLSHSCVIGTGGFTRSANEIARNTGVRLIDANDIASFSAQFGF